MWTYLAKCIGDCPRNSICSTTFPGQSRKNQRPSVVSGWGYLNHSTVNSLPAMTPKGPGWTRPFGSQPIWRPTWPLGKYRMGALGERGWDWVVVVLGWSSVLEACQCCRKYQANWPICFSHGRESRGKPHFLSWIAEPKDWRGTKVEVTTSIKPLKSQT